jgi:hypothetical protein
MTYSVFAILCLPSGCAYVGRSTNPAAFWKTCRGNLDRQELRNQDLQAAWDFHGPAAFVFRVVAEGLDDRASAELVGLAIDAARAVDRSFNATEEERGRRVSEAKKGAPAANRRRVVVGRSVYASLGDAGRAHGLSAAAVHARVNSARWGEWRYAAEWW